MSQFNRRLFLGAAAAAGLAAAVDTTEVANAATGSRRSQIPLTREDHRVVIIGSGFGGGVAAMRLAEAGVPVLVLERGKRWATGPNASTFPDATAPDKRMLWYGSSPNLFGRPVPFDPYVGLLEAGSATRKHPFRALAVSAAAQPHLSNLRYQAARNDINRDIDSISSAGFLHLRLRMRPLCRR